jgi:trehalose 6-phosphate phosphatase
LLEIAETPHSVHVPESLNPLLIKISSRVDGALALISGRGLADIDRLFAPSKFCASGVHGCERRDASGNVVKAVIDADCLAPVRAEIERFTSQHEGLLLEDKGYGLALHFRRAPHLEATVLQVAEAACRRLGPQFVLQPGKSVFEIRPAGCDKGAAIEAFMRQPPFAARVPVFIGDDVTDEQGFAAVNALKGISIKVGEGTPTLARHRLKGVTDVIGWLEKLASFTDLNMAR